MSTIANTVWITVNRSFRGYDQPLLRQLSLQTSIARWEYEQEQDEASSLDMVQTLLHDYLQSQDSAVHLVGHGTGGLAALLYARQFPERVRSLTLLAVGVHPAIDWQAHFYAQLKLLNCPREVILTQMVYSLFGYQSQPIARQLIKLLEADLHSAPSLHTLFQQGRVCPGKPPIPTLVCGSRDDMVVSPPELEGWQDYLGDFDRLWLCPKGRHFFHYFYPHLVARQILNFWASLPVMPTLKDAGEPLPIYRNGVF